MSASAIARRLARRLRWEDLDPAAIAELIAVARREDLAGWGLARPPERPGDLSSAVLPQGQAKAQAALVAREELVVCGLPLAPLVLQAYGDGAAFTPVAADGAPCGPGDCLGILTGPATLLLAAERVLLNFLQHLAGVATLTRQYVAALGDSPTRLLDTRKTTPGFRALEKYAVACGGGFNHRMGLFDRVMLKDNHLAAAGAVSGQALHRLVADARKAWPDVVVEVEVDALDQIPPVLEAGADVLLLDNFSLADLQRAVALIGDRAATEASGGVTLAQLPALGRIGLDFVSTGATVHKAAWKDIGLDWA